MFMILAIAVVTLMHFYIWKRIIRDTGLPARARRLLTGILIVLSVLLIATLFLPGLTGQMASAWYAWPGFVWLGLAFYLCLCLLVSEPLRMVLRLKRTKRPSESQVVVTESPATVNRRVFLARTSAVVAGAASVSLVGFGAANALGPPNLLQVPIHLRRLDRTFNDFRIAVVSDIHLGPLLGRSHTERIVQMINETDADLVAIVGDLVDGSVGELGHAAEPLQDLVSREGTFFVTGNHEYFVDDTVPWLRELERLGVQTLRNENTAIRRGSATFNLAGVNDIAGKRHSDAPDFDQALDGIDPSRPTVLLAHQPVMVTEAAARGVDLQVSGHTHGGQMWPFQYVVDAAQPALAGLSTVDDTQLYVTRGAGFWGPPVRVGAPPDITVLSLRR